MPTPIVDYTPRKRDPYQITSPEQAGEYLDTAMKSDVLAQAVETPGTIIRGAQTGVVGPERTPETYQMIYGNTPEREGEEFLRLQAEREAAQREAEANKQAQEVKVLTSAPAKQYTVDTAQQIAEKQAGLAEMVKKVEGDFQNIVQREYAPKETEIRKKAGEAREELTEQQKEEAATLRTRQFRLGQEGTAYAGSEISKMETQHAKQLRNLAEKEQDLLNQAWDATLRNQIGIAEQLKGEAANVDKQIAATQANVEKARQERLQTETMLEERVGKTVDRMIQSGFEPTDTQLEYLDQRYGLPVGTSQTIYAANRAIDTRKREKESREELQGMLNIEKTLADLEDRPIERQSKLLDLKAKIDASKTRVYDEMNKIFDVMKKAPPGMQIEIGDASYFGMGNNAVYEKDGAGNGRIAYIDPDGNVQVQNVGFMGDPQDLEEVYVNGMAVLRNKRTKQLAPLTIGPNAQPGADTWSSYFPTGTQSPYRSKDDPYQGECGAFLNDLYSVGKVWGNTVNEKVQQAEKYKVEKDQIQTGDSIVMEAGQTGHVALVNYVGIDDEGNKFIRLTESNYVPPGGKKISNERTMLLNDPRLLGVARIPLNNERIPLTGPDSLASSRVLEPAIETNPFIIPNVPMSSAQMQEATQKFEQAKSGARELLEGGSLSDIPLEIRSEAKQIARRNGWTPSTSDKEYIEKSDTLRKEFIALPEVKEFKIIRDSYSQIQTVGQEPSAAGDLALIFSYMKLLDPNSVVRETEFANAQNAAGVPDMVRNYWNRALRGERLNEKQRKDFTNKSGTIYKSRLRQIEPTMEQYRDLAKKRNLDPNDVIFDISYVEPEIEAEKGAERILSNKIYRYDGKEWVYVADTELPDRY